MSQKSGGEDVLPPDKNKDQLIETVEVNLETSNSIINNKNINLNETNAKILNTNYNNNIYKVNSINNVYKVLVENKSENTISNLKVAEIIFNTTKSKDVLDIQKIGKNRITVSFNNMDSANNLLNNKILKDKNFGVFIPVYYVARAAVIRDVDVDYDEETLKNNIEAGQFQINKVQRMFRKIENNGNAEFIPKKSVKIYFDGQDIPQYVFIWNVRFLCQPFIRKLKQCMNCLRFGHHVDRCKGQEKCKKCGEKFHKAKSCTSSVIKCANCNRNHWAMDKDCPERKRHEEINNAMGMRNLSYQEAIVENPVTHSNNNLYSVVTQNRFDMVNEDFPSLCANDNTNEIPIYMPAPRRPQFRQRKFLATKEVRRENIVGKRIRDETDRENYDNRNSNIDNNEQKKKELQIFLQVW